jgi:hypothetical protein
MSSNLPEPTSSGDDIKEPSGFKWPDIKPKLTKAIEDPLEFKPNKCSSNARKIKTVHPSLKYEVWFDQHYHIRNQIGDALGSRNGIEAEIVEPLVLKSMPYLIALSSFLDTFSFVNHNNKTDRGKRVVLQQDSEHGKLNVVIEAHSLGIDHYEITVKTAMCSDTFKVSDGQYAIYIDGEAAILRKMSRGNLVDVYHL